MTALNTRSSASGAALSLARQAAQALGRLGGRATSEAKAEAARANGAKGGRPKTKKRKPR